MTGENSTRRSAARIARHITHLGHPNPTVAYRAERYLIRYYGTRALEPLIAACDNPNPPVRFRAVWALAHTRDARAFDTVLRLTADPDGGVRYDTGEIFEDYAAEGVPFTALIGQDGRVAAVNAHGMSLERAVVQALAEKQVSSSNLMGRTASP